MDHQPTGTATDAAKETAAASCQGQSVLSRRSGIEPLACRRTNRVPSGTIRKAASSKMTATSSGRMTRIEPSRHTVPSPQVLTSGLDVTQITGCGYIPDCLVLAYLPAGPPPIRLKTRSRRLRHFCRVLLIV